MTLLILTKSDATRFLSYKTRLALASSVMGLSVWSMHFLGMLALTFPLPVVYSFIPTFTSALIAISITGLAIYTATSGVFPKYGTTIGSVLMGLGISCMHYVGVEALRVVCGLSYTPMMIILAVTSSIFFSYITLRILNTSSFQNKYNLVAAVFLGLGISSMHYIAMFGTNFYYLDNLSLNPSGLSTTVMTIVLSVISFLVLNTLILMILPKAKAQAFKRDVPSEEKVLHQMAQTIPLSQVMAGTSREGSGKPASLYDIQKVKNLEMKHGGQIQYLTLNQIVFISADGHYTNVGYLRSDDHTLVTHFCERSLATIYKDFAAFGFVKVHRSHIVNMLHIQGHKKKGETGEVLFDTDHIPIIPISRLQYPAFLEAYRKNLGWRGAS
tara:strand:- start:1490 stop:2641 length:1152 start_codon:yes stop_codon:yes gene_type:complete